MSANYHAVIPWQVAIFDFAKFNVMSRLTKTSAQDSSAAFQGTVPVKIVQQLQRRFDIKLIRYDSSFGPGGVTEFPVKTGRHSIT